MPTGSEHWRSLEVYMKHVCAITGTSGYVGSRISEALFSDFTIVPLGRRVKSGGIRWQLGGGSVQDELCKRAVTVLIHAAWDFSHRGARDNWQANVEGSKMLIDDALSAGVRQIVFISSISSFPSSRSQYGMAKYAVEQLVTKANGTVIRSGLVWGENAGGVFGSLEERATKGGIMPMIGNGGYLQYLVHEDDLVETVRRAAHGEFHNRVLTVAHPGAWPLRSLILQMAHDSGKEVSFIHVPWYVVYMCLRAAEALGLKLDFRSDSVMSLVYQDRTPNLSRALQLRAFRSETPI